METYFFHALESSNPLYTLRRSQVSQPRTASATVQPNMGEFTACENTFIITTKFVCLPSFGLLNSLWFSTSPTTHTYTRTVSGQTDTLLLCTFCSYKCIYIHIYIYKYDLITLNPFVLSSNTHIHRYVRATLTTIQLTFVQCTLTHMYIHKKHIRTLLLCIDFSSLVLFYKKYLF